MSLIWFNKNETKINASIGPNNITLNASAVHLFKSIDRVRLGFDTDKHTIIIELLDRDKSESLSYDESQLLTFQSQSSYVRINCTAFITLLKELLPDFNNKLLPVKFEARYDDRKQILIIDLEKEV